jgi:hypothetical protein
VTRIVVLVTIAVAVVVGVLALRNNAMTVHTDMPAGSRLIVDANARWKGERESAPRLAQALVVQCVTETATHVTPVSFDWHGGDFTFEIRPALDEPDRRQLKGCLSDLRMPRLIVAVDEMRTLT